MKLEKFIVAAEVMVESADEARLVLGDRLVGLVYTLLQEAPGSAAMYEKCLHCHLFVEPNGEGPEFAEYIHLHRGDDADERIDESHEAKPSGFIASLDAWKVFGPSMMRERFVNKDRV